MSDRLAGKTLEGWQELADIINLIEAHRNAKNAWGDAIIADECSVIQNGGGPLIDLIAFEAGERKALDALLRWRPSTVRGEAERLRYLFRDPCGPWHDTGPEPSEVDLLISSMDGR